jgi:succinoglycan biosynthesis protein ExoA
MTSPFNNCQVIVAIPTLNEAETIEAVLRKLSLEKQDVPRLEIVVVDGGSLDSTISTVERVSEEFPFVHTLQNPKRIQSTAINIAARAWAANANVLVRCDAHSVYPEKYVARLLETLHRTKADSVVVPMDSVGRSCFQKAVAWVSDTRAGSGGSGHRGGTRSGFVDHGHHAAFQLHSFLAAGGYDETFTHNEDAELDCRLNAMGGKVYLDADIRIQYFPRENPRSLWRQYFNYGRGRSRTMRRHPGTLRIRQMVVPAHFAFSVLSIALAISFGSWLATVWPLFYLTMLAAVSLALFAKHRSICALFAGLAAFVMHSAWASGFFYGVLFVKERRWKIDEQIVPLA